MKLIPYSVTRKLGRQLLVAKKNSPHLFFAGGMVGLVGTVFLACRATLKLEKELDNIKQDLDNVKEVASNRMQEHDYDEREYYKDLGYIYIKSATKVAKLYGPSIALGGASVVALTGSHVQMTRRNAALSATIAVITEAFESYRYRVQQEIGESKELDIYRGVVDEAISIDGKKKLAKVDGELGRPAYARTFDGENVNWQKDPELNRIFIQCQQNYANHLLRARGHVFLNEVYDALGFPRTKEGAVVGWLYHSDEGDGYIDFGLYDDINSNFIISGNAYAVSLDFNVDGIVFDKI